MDQITYREMIYPSRYRFQKSSEKQNASVRYTTQASNCAVFFIWSKNVVPCSSYLHHNFFHGRWEPDIRNMENLKARFASNRSAQNPRARCNGTGKEPRHLSDHTWFDIDWPTRSDQIHLSKSRFWFSSVKKQENVWTRWDSNQYLIADWSWLWVENILSTWFNQLFKTFGSFAERRGFGRVRALTHEFVSCRARA